MKGYRFFAEMPEHRGSKSASKHCYAFDRAFLERLVEEGLHQNCVAVSLDEKGQPLWIGDTLTMEAVVTDSDLSNSPVATCQTTRGYLRTRCVRISAELARKLHPRLFSYLETDPRPVHLSRASGHEAAGIPPTTGADMLTTLTLHGDIPVAASCADAVDKLIKDIGIEDAEIDFDGRFVSIHIGETVGSGTPKRVLDAVAAFIRDHATAGAVFDYGDSTTLTFGPTPEARRAARLAYLEDMVATYQAALESETCRDISYWQPEVI